MLFGDTETRTRDRVWLEKIWPPSQDVLIDVHSSLMPRTGRDKETVFGGRGPSRVA